MVEFVREAFEGGEIDMDYEFDAPRFYDFTRPKTGREAEEAEEWFLSAGGYQPSLLNPLAFLEKLLNLQKRIHPEPVKNSTEPKDVEEVDSNNCMEAEVSVVVDDNIRDEVVFTVMFYGVSTRLELPNHMALDTPSAKPKSPGKSPPLSRSSTLMKPTASQLAEQNHRREIHSNRLLRRVAKKLRKLDEKSQNSPPPTKRHKLEAGYVRKVAEQLKHQHLWLHKVSKKVGADAARPKVTIRRNQIWKQQIEHKDLLHDFGKIFCLVYEGLPNEHITLIFRFSGLLHGLALKNSQFQQQSFRCFAFGHQRELCKRHTITM
ncbi:uncharacterized protein LOC108866529 [Pyrus x bretschneideri]|uniref:uncharacterized protein LOC108866529 n=1 Tax=Pyrus x bretschneideri TaxID=225117 RepID=UPI00202ED1D4|nr:uncharacterized protein LOC108866529 [Pyrus x bretschneideri]